MPETPSSPYRVGNWTVTKLKNELKDRNLSPMGKKVELIARLERHDSEGGGTPSRRRGRPAKSDQFSESDREQRSVVLSSPSPVGRKTVVQLQDELRVLGLFPRG